MKANMIITRTLLSPAALNAYDI